jgi:rhodanese-related sulfurtransferase
VPRSIARRLSALDNVRSAHVSQNITWTSKMMVEAAKREIEEIPAADATALVGRDDVVLVDVRDPRELARDGRVPGAFHCPRGMLEFWIDPESPYHKPVFAEDRKFVFFCGGGLRSALAAKVAKDMGLEPVAHVVGGFAAWKEAGGPVEPSAA